MARSALRDPLDKYRWTVAIDGFSRLGFTQCGTPQYNITQKNYAEGGRHLNPLSIVDRVDYVPVTLSRGVTNDTSFNKWATSFIDLVTNSAAFKDLDTELSLGMQVFNAAADNGASSVASHDSTGPNPFGDGEYPFRFRRDVKIEHTNRAGQVEVIYVLYNAYPISYKPASDFDATGDDTVSIESLTLAYEGFEVKYAGVAGLAANIGASFL